MLNIIICVKAVSDPETVAHYVVSGVGVHIDEQNKKIIPEGIETVISPFDELAAEAALRIKDELGTGVTITAICLGTEDGIKILRRVLAMGVDEAILLKDEDFEDANDMVTAHALAAAIRKIGAFDLIVCGRQAADVDSGVIGSGLSELLGVPSVTLAKDVQVQDHVAQVERSTPEEIEKIEMPLPALVTVSSELGEPRFPKMKGMLAAKRKEIPVWNAQDLGLDRELITEQNKCLKLEKISVVEMRGQCEFVEGESPEEIAAMLIQKLKEERILQN
jgi:electron transfer flavoprotein beta subunit